VTAAVWVIIIIPGIIRVVETAVIIGIHGTVFIIKIPVIQIAPLTIVPHLHAKKAVVIILFLIALGSIITNLIAVLVFLFRLRFGRRIIYIIGGLSSTIGGAATSDGSGSDQCQDK
jgi:hypothetical protein